MLSLFLHPQAMVINNILLFFSFSFPVAVLELFLLEKLHGANNKVNPLSPWWELKMEH